MNLSFCLNLFIRDLTFSFFYFIFIFYFLFYLPLGLFVEESLKNLRYRTKCSKDYDYLLGRNKGGEGKMGITGCAFIRLPWA